VSSFKSALKHLFYLTGSTFILDKLLFRIAWLKNKKKNDQYKRHNPDFPIPTDYFLYETYLLDYNQYSIEGEASAKEIVEWTGKYFEAHPKAVLEWGCGVSRIVRHLYKFIDPKTIVYACDINEAMIEWSKNNINNIAYSKIDYIPPTQYFLGQFDMVYAISVLTHIDTTQQKNWIIEIHRMLADNGIFLFTTHGSHYFHHLISSEKKELNEKGAYTRYYNKKGHRMMTTYNSAKEFCQLIEQYFQVLEFCEGDKNPEKIGGQDLWIAKKKNC
jgi:SAM-dependent methyltransferase